MSYARYRRYGTCIRVVETGDIYRNGKECAEHLNASPSLVSQCISGARPTCKGYHLEQIDLSRDEIPDKIRDELDEILNDGRNWREHPSIRNVYVTDDGDMLKFCEGRWIEVPQYDARGGYKRAYVNRENYRMTHCYVAETFIENPDNKPEVNHKNGNKHDNSVSNLEWNTTSENMLHAYRTGLARAKSQQIKIVETGEVYDSQYDCAKAIGGCQQNISACLKGKRSTHKGCHFELIDQEDDYDD